MRKFNFAIVYLFVLYIFICPSIANTPEQVRCTGKVLNTKDQPIAGAKVTAYEMQFDGIAGNFMLHQAGEVTTAEDGAFTFTTDPKPEKSTFYECKIVAVKQDLALGWAAWNMRENVEVNIEIGRPERLDGVIVDEEGKPVTDAQVRVNLSRTVKTADGEDNNQWLPGIAPLQELGTQTNRQGRFHFNNLPANTGVDLLIMAPGKSMIYTYQSAPPEPAFKAGQTDIKVTLPAEARIEGKIIDPDTGQGIGRTKFAVVATFSGLFYYRFVHTTNDDGTFDIGGLQTGKYLIRGEFPSVKVDVISGKSTSDILIGVNRQEDGLTPEQTTTERKRDLQIYFGMRILELPPDVSDDIFEPDQGLSSGILVRQGHEAADRLLKLTQEKKDARVLSSPQLLTYVGREAGISMAAKEYISGYELAGDGSGELIPKKEILYASDYKIKGTLEGDDRIHLTLSASLQEPVFETRQYRKGYDYQIPLPGQYFSVEGITKNNEPMIVGCLRPGRPALYLIITPSCLLPEPKPESLLGKILPDFDNIQNIKNLDNIEGKPILVCFFDMEQRPSRNCVQELSKRAKELKEKSIAVITVQSSKIEQEKLAEWIKDQNISFPVGMIKADEEKTRFTWGVKSLPWLILTDNKHIITTEGFAINEMEDIIKSASVD